MNNPFESIDKRLSNIEALLLDIKHPEPRPEPSDRIGLAEACTITGLSKPAIYKLTSLKQLPHMKFGRRLVFSRRALNAWVEENTKSPEQSPADLAMEKLTKEARRHEKK